MNGLGLCAGYGGIDLGLGLARPDYRAVCFVEIEAYVAAVLAARMEDGFLDSAPIWDNLRTFDGQPWRGLVDIVAAGFPCQPASVAGQRRGTADERWLWPGIVRVLWEVQPRWVFLENVRGLLSVGGGAAFEEVLSGLAALGFNAEWLCLRASDVGAPHRRERIFILAHRDVADALGVGQRKSNDEAVPLAWERPREVAGGRGGSLGHSESPGLSEWGAGGGTSFGRPERSSTPLFPPGPADHDRWVDLLGERPDLAPALESTFRQFADGYSPIVGATSRADWLRALGNGCVPLQVAVAFQSLLQRFTQP